MDEEKRVPEEWVLQCLEKGRIGDFVGKHCSTVSELRIEVIG